MKTFIVGYSSDPERFSNKAYKMLKEYGHQGVKINPREDDEAFKSINDALKRHNHPHTITMHVNGSISSKLKEEILKAHPKRVIFNPDAKILN